jgi:hypothetical protein
MKTKKIWLLLLCVPLYISCLGDLDTEPKIEQTLDNLLANDPDAVKGILAKLYGGLVLHGQGVPGSGNQIPDILGDDPGETVYFRSLWNLQEMPTDIVKNRWGDNGLDPLTTASGWVATNKFFGYMYNRIFFQVGQANNFILDVGSISFDDKDLFIAEARFLRALAYYHAMDLFGGVPIVTEADGIGGANKPRATREEVFDFVERELLDLENLIPATNEYGRANRATVQMVLAKIYLNSEIYTGQNRYAQALDYASRVIADSQFALAENYQSIFQGNNYLSTEIIFPLIGDRNNVQSYGNATYLVNGSLSSDTMTLTDYGASAGWVGHRCTKALYSLFGDLATTQDSRAIFWTTGHQYEMNDYREWTDGYPTTKFRNTYYNDPTAPEMNFSDTDIPLFRLADAYLMYAEAHLRGGGGSAATALGYVNALRQRAYGDASGNITAGDLTLDFIIDERARELYYEGHRRQDLIRFGRFTGGVYNWPWKGGVPNGTSIPSSYRLYPIPLEALQANPNLLQNPGY